MKKVKLQYRGEDISTSLERNEQRKNTKRRFAKNILDNSYREENEKVEDVEGNNIKILNSLT